MCYIYRIKDREGCLWLRKTEKAGAGFYPRC